MEGREISLAEVLAFRDWKASMQEEMFQKWSNAVVVSIGMNIPGPVKTSSLIGEAFEEGMCALETMFAQKEVHILQRAVIEQDAGYTAIYAVENLSGMEMKRETVSLEEDHPLGRIFDIDVIENRDSIQRQVVGKAERRCLICRESAKACGRSRAHSVEELQDKVLEIMETWKAGE